VTALGRSPSSHGPESRIRALAEAECRLARDPGRERARLSYAGVTVNPEAGRSAPLSRLEWSTARARAAKSGRLFSRTSGSNASRRLTNWGLGIGRVTFTRTTWDDRFYRCDFNAAKYNYFTRNINDLSNSAARDTEIRTFSSISGILATSARSVISSAASCAFSTSDNRRL
jgi:hypothetical protein